MAASRAQRGAIIEGINVTPLVDIVLVLLIIFIVTAKIVIAPAVPLDLPKAAQSEELQTIFAVTMPVDGSLLVNGEAIDEAGLTERARAELAGNPELRAVIQADGDVPHRRVIAILDRLKDAGLARVAFAVVKPESEAMSGVR
jgi:biopolymer transport protein ExbD